MRKEQQTQGYEHGVEDEDPVVHTAAQRSSCSLGIEEQVCREGHSRLTPKSLQ